jgi:hypothetical protein
MVGSVSDAIPYMMGAFLVTPLALAKIAKLTYRLLQLCCVMTVASSASILTLIRFFNEVKSFGVIYY